MKASVIFYCCAVAVLLLTTSLVEALVVRRDCRQVCGSNIRCPFGYVKAANGCPTCRCRQFPMPDPCKPLRQCPNYCRQGYEITASGCTNCKCRRRQIHNFQSE